MTLKPDHAAVFSPPAAGGRFAAGEDPAKRQQILAGAKRVFMKMGFDAASMNDVTREAGVSKGTLYVYFTNKEELFSAMIETERAAFVAAVRTALAEHDDPEAGLYEFGISFVTHMTDEKVINAMRTVLGVRDRMPVLCQRFFKGPENLRTIMRDFLERHIAEGRFEIDDIDLAAGQFLDLASGSFFKLRLFGSMEEPPSRDEIERVIRGAIRVFMAAYGARRRETA
ncbi:TetR/AcrR family transcriptional regulator [Rhizobium beringeri]|jgi:AcrR family transcriptional regulator|uniref:TetR/AcrR family transcriptional regulator n=1 Tax=Rhizobium beringeri TaxID=3019934 RepID=UPI002DDCFFB9|nr:TetR/AcrR family transcriptional regulator [Rhizobium beringeri]WSG88469.1 TetR/AcrR family transcriptional regulator [Rhizobium beringeri]WSH26828.1 TetR/AcrR family transcriptional regulator [Rhizobium beringeri]WSH79682.1 TetR/AcrR family transcriptional regulator [Rhizobium beringeri]